MAADDVEWPYTEWLWCWASRPSWYRQELSLKWHTTRGSLPPADDCLVARAMAGGAVFAGSQSLECQLGLQEGRLKLLSWGDTDEAFEDGKMKGVAGATKALRKDTVVAAEDTWAEDMQQARLAAALTVATAEPGSRELMERSILARAAAIARPSG